MRIDHWLKNIFILFGHAVAVVIFFDLEFHTSFISKIILSMIPACLIASANYIINEILDAPFDRLHPTKKDRPIPSGKAKVNVLWVLYGALIVLGMGLGWVLFPNLGYNVSLLLLLISGYVYNVEPLRMKDRAFIDVIAESFNNPIRLWLGWYALVPDLSLPPISITLAWWLFGGLLMTGKRYSEYRFIGDREVSNKYRKSFQDYSERSMKMAMITYAVGFFSVTLYALITEPQLRPLLPTLALLIAPIAFYLNAAFHRDGARLEPEQLLRRPLVIASTTVVVGAAVWMLNHGKEKRIADSQSKEIPMSEDIPLMDTPSIGSMTREPGGDGW